MLREGLQPPVTISTPTFTALAVPVLAVAVLALVALVSCLAALLFISATSNRAPAPAAPALVSGSVPAREAADFAPQPPSEKTAAPRDSAEGAVVLSDPPRPPPPARFVPSAVSSSTVRGEEAGSWRVERAVRIRHASTVQSPSRAPTLKHVPRSPPLQAVPLPTPLSRPPVLATTPVAAPAPEAVAVKSESPSLLRPSAPGRERGIVRTAKPKFGFIARNTLTMPPRRSALPGPSGGGIFYLVRPGDGSESLERGDLVEYSIAAVADDAPADVQGRVEAVDITLVAKRFLAPAASEES
jgi:hypothetical protein